MLDQLVQQFTKELRIEDAVTQNEPGHYLFEFEDMNVDVIGTEQGYFLRSSIGDCPQVNTEEFLIRLSEANMFGQGTRDAVIGLNFEGTQMVLSMELDPNITYREFRDKFEDFLNVIDFWKNEALKQH